MAIHASEIPIIRSDLYELLLDTGKYFSYGSEVLNVRSDLAK